MLIDTFTTNGVSHATVEVDGIVYNPAEGETFAGGNFELRDVAGNCATFLFGDESFTLCFDPVQVDGSRSRRSAHGGSGRRRGGGLSGPPPPHPGAGTRSL